MSHPQEDSIRKSVIAFALHALLLSAAHAAIRTEIAKPVIQFIEAFNTGDLKTAYATLVPGDITIVDEFAPHRWTGTDAPQLWAADYDKHAKATGVTDGKVTSSNPTRVEVEGKVAYVILPTVYLYNEHGKPSKEEGQVTATLHHGPKVWKMTDWTWTGVYPDPAK